MATLTVHDGKKMLSPAQQRQRELAAVKTGLYASGTAARLRHRRLRAKVRTLRKQFPVLANAPDHLVLRYAEVDTLAASVWVNLQEHGVTNEAGEPRRLLEEYRRLLAELRSLAEALGLLAPAADPDPLASLLGGRR